MVAPTLCAVLMAGSGRRHGGSLVVAWQGNAEPLTQQARDPRHLLAYYTCDS